MPKNATKFSERLQEEFPFIKLSSGVSCVICTLCNSNFSVANRGRRDITSHMKSLKHQKGEQKNFKVFAASPKVSDGNRRTSRSKVKRGEETSDESSTAFESVQLAGIENPEKFDTRNCFVCNFALNSCRYQLETPTKFTETPVLNFLGEFHSFPAF